MAEPQESYDSIKYYTNIHMNSECGANVECLPPLSDSPVERISMRELPARVPRAAREKKRNIKEGLCVAV